MSQGIIDRLFLRKYRKYAISQDVKDNVSRKIKNIVENSLPIVFIPSFGGYKHWWSPTYPTIDWAEVFNMKFILQYLAPVYNSYTKAPVSIEYESEEVAYVGDDIPDFEAMQMVGLSVAPVDAADDIKEIATYISPCRGGEGVGRDLLEQIMRVRGDWMSTANAFGW